MSLVTILNYVLLLIVFGALALFGGIWAFQNYGIYSFSKQVRAPSEFGIAGVRAVSFKSADGQTINALVVPPKEGRALIVSFYGNDSGLVDSLQRLNRLIELGYGVAMMEYRGSGTTGGKPSEENFARDALAFYDQLDTLLGQPIVASRRVMHGFSLGAGVGSRLAASREFAAVVLEASPYRACLYYSDRYKGFPFCSLMWAERYDIVDYVRQIRSPKLIVHGRRDEALPVERARRLYDEAGEPKEFVEIEQGGHADLSRLGLISAMNDFIKRYVR